MSQFLCNVCSNFCWVSSKERKLLDFSGDFVCSKSCLLTWIKKHGDSTRLNPKYVVGCEQPCMGTADNCYSTLVQMAFRSRYELVVAELFYLSHIYFEYEKYGFLLKSNNTFYIPDFFLTKEKIFIEVKGLWRAGARNKVERFREDYSEYPFLVISWPLRKIFNSKSWNTGE